MEGAQKFQISVEYKIYCLFLLTRVFFSVKIQIWRQIQMD